MDTGSGEAEEIGKRLRRQAAAEELLVPSEGSSMGSGVGSGLGSGMILGESGSGLDGMDPSKMEAEEEISVTESKTDLLQAENALPVSTSSNFIKINSLFFLLLILIVLFVLAMKPAATGKDVTTKKSSAPTTKMPKGGVATTKAPGKSKAKKLVGGKKKKMCKAVMVEKPNCNTTQHGCCPDGTTVAKGPFGAGNFI